MRAKEIASLPQAEKEKLFIQLGEELFPAYTAERRVSKEVFYWMCRSFVLPSYELFVLNPAWRALLLIRRPDDDSEFPRLLHSPGTIIQRLETLEMAHDRLITREIGCPVTTPVFVKAHRFLPHPGYSRSEVNLQHVCIAESVPAHGKFYPLDSLPVSEMIAHHVKMANYLREWIRSHY